MGPSASQNNQHNAFGQPAAHGDYYQTGFYPQQTGFYPHQAGFYPPQTGFYPHQTGLYSPHTGFYPHQTDIYNLELTSSPPDFTNPMDPRILDSPQQYGGHSTPGAHHPNTSHGGPEGHGQGGHGSRPH